MKTSICYHLHVFIQLCSTIIIIHLSYHSLSVHTLPPCCVLHVHNRQRIFVSNYGCQGKIKVKNYAPKLRTTRMSVFRGSITEYPGVIVDHFTAFNCERGRVFFLSHCHKGTRVRAQAGEAWEGEEAQWDTTCFHENSCSDLRLSLSQLFCCFN